MAAPEYVPNTRDQQPRRGLGLPPARAWVPDRPGELKAEQPEGRTLGRPGPDQGFALRLARAFEDRMVLDGVQRPDAVAGCIGIALRRAAAFGRAPVVHDLEVAFRIWGFLGDAPPELVEARRPRFEAASHRYWDQRAIVDLVPDATLRLTHAEVRARFPGDWRVLVGLDRRATTSG